MAKKEVRKNLDKYYPPGMILVIGKAYNYHALLSIIRRWTSLKR